MRFARWAFLYNTVPCVSCPSRKIRSLIVHQHLNGQIPGFSEKPSLHGAAARVRAAMPQIKPFARFTDILCENYPLRRPLVATFRFIAYQAYIL